MSEALKKRVKAREESAFVGIVVLAKETGLPENFIFNAIESQLLEERFNMIGASWFGPGGDRTGVIGIPVVFGLPLD